MAPTAQPGGNPMKIVDPHQHFWTLQENYYPWLCDPEMIPFRYGDYSAIRRNYLPEDFRRDTARFQVVKTVHIEAEIDPNDPLRETRWLEALSKREGLPSAAVGQAWFAREDIAEILAAQAASPLIRGIRQKPVSATDPRDAKRGQPGSMDCPVWRKGYALMGQHGLSYDLQTPWWHLDAAADLAADFPETRIILNHTGLPADRSAEGLAGWRKAMEGFAALPNVALKISGLGRKGQPWTVEANGPIVRDAIAIFGVERAMFASNYPVDSLAGDYTTIFEGFAEAVADRSEAERRALFHDNAVRIYRL